MDEVDRHIEETTETHSVQTKFRMDAKERIEFRRSEANLLSILEATKLCEASSLLYLRTTSRVQADWKARVAAGTLAVEPSLEHSDMATAHKSACNSVLEDAEDAALLAFRSPDMPLREVQRRVCVETLKVCDAIDEKRSDYHPKVQTPEEIKRDAGFAAQEEVRIEAQREKSKKRKEDAEAAAAAAAAAAEAEAETETETVDDAAAADEEVEAVKTEL
jgi:hypothetical protein